MKTIKTLLLIGTITALSASSYELSCARPLKPTSMDSNREIRKYNTDSRNYKACIDDFIRTHKEDRKKETQAINYAIDEWNSYVNGTPKKKDKSVTANTGVSQGGKHTVDHSDPTSVYKNIKF